SGSRWPAGSRAPCPGTCRPRPRTTAAASSSGCRPRSNQVAVSLSAESCRTPLKVSDTRVGVVVLIALVARCGSARSPPAPPPPPRPVKAKPKPLSPLWATVTGRLGAPLQDAAAAVKGGRVVLLGGLSAADASTTTILHATATGARAAGALPHA